MKSALGLQLVILGAAMLTIQAAPTARKIPRPPPDHPGNIFVVGESVRLAAPYDESERWRVVDYEGRTVAEGNISQSPIDLGQLPAGYYKVFRGTGQATNPISLAVLQPLRAPTPLSSPICIDLAMSWFYPPERMASVANLCALAGMNRVRDRLAWQELEPRRGELAASNRYDLSAQAQSSAGLQVLQVNHSSPSWANPNTKRFPLDLRDIYNLHREIGRRWRGQVVAFEPWNEADIKEFGGHTGSEMASLQKAAYLGLKSGNPNAIACLNVFAIHRASTLHNFDDNEVWPYFDTFNLHHYEALDRYPQLYADFRAVSAGRPLWVTECSVPVKWHGDEQLKEPSREDLRVQSERVAKIYAEAIHEGAQAVFYFMLPHYAEGQTQFGVLHPDLSPRPAYVALAAAGRLLADARPLGRLQTAQASIHGYLFAAKPDGKRQEVLVIWSDDETTFELPRGPKVCFDHLGRDLSVHDNKLRLTRAPVFVRFGPSTHLPLLAPPEAPALRTGKPSTVVLQALVSEAKIILDQSAYKIETGGPTKFQLVVYNFGERKAKGRLTITPPADWAAECLSDIEVLPGERKVLDLQVTPKGTANTHTARMNIVGDFGPAGRSVISLQFLVGTP